MAMGASNVLLAELRAETSPTSIIQITNPKTISATIWPHATMCCIPSWYPTPTAQSRPPHRTLKRALKGKGQGKKEEEEETKTRGRSVPHGEIAGFPPLGARPGSLPSPPPRPCGTAPPPARLALPACPGASSQSTGLEDGFTQGLKHGPSMKVNVYLAIEE